MKKKILMFLIALFMFIPLTIVKADIDDITNKIKEQFGITAGNNSIQVNYGGIPAELKVEKLDNSNKIKISTTTDMNALVSLSGLVDPEELMFISYITYEYDDNNKVLTYNGEYGDNRDSIYEEDSSFAVLAETLNSQLYKSNAVCTREVTYAVYKLQYPSITSNDTIKTYLQSIGIMDSEGTMSLYAREKSKGIKVETDGQHNVTNYSIYLNEIENPLEINNNETNTDNNNNNQTTTPTDNLAGHGYATDDNNFSISFVDVFGKQYEFTVKSLSNVRKAYASKEDTEPTLETIDRQISNLKEELKDNGTYIDLYNIVVSYGNEEKKDGPFTFRIKYTEEMKKYNTFELINIVNNKKTNDIVKMKVEGDYLVGELPHLSDYALVGRKTDNPGTGVTKYTVPGVALLLTTFGIYALYKKKSEI